VWIIFALLAALLWGFNYVLIDKLVRKVSPATIFTIQLLIASLIMFIISLKTGKFTQDLSTIWESKQIFLYMVLIILGFTSANYLNALAIQAKNATLASLIEISYPLFVIVLAWLLFREATLSLSVLGGGLLIFAGITIIYVFNR
jgi:drug/metabolite transporter (DMT)-like permease